MSVIDDQLKELQKEFPLAGITPLPDGSHVVAVPGVKLPSGWSQPQTTVKFLTLANYPNSVPDCFWVEPHIKLANGAPPQNTNLQVIPGTGDNWLWFSWHANRWNPNRDTLSTYLNVIAARLREPK
jgi:hypothetical protein